MEKIERIKHLEQELGRANEVSIRLQKELDEAKLKISKVEKTNQTSVAKKKAPMLSSIGKLPSGDGVSKQIVYCRVRIVLFIEDIFARKYRENR